MSILCLSYFYLRSLFAYFLSHFSLNLRFLLAVLSVFVGMMVREVICDRYLLYPIGTYFSFHLHKEMSREVFLLCVPCTEDYIYDFGVYIVNFNNIV